MRVTCPSCHTNYNIDDKRIPPGGAKLKCAKCQNTFPIRPAAEAVPLPAADPTIPLPGAGPEEPAAWESEATRVVPMNAVPLPGEGAPPSDEGGFADADLVDSGPHARRPVAPAAPAGPGFDFEELPPAPPNLGAPPPDDFGLDFSGAEPGSAPPEAIDFSDLPSPAPAPAFELPSPSAAPPMPDFGVDFSEPPLPARAAPPADPAASMGFGEVDFGDPAPAPAVEDPLEFDPTAGEPQRDDLEADLSAPIPAAPASGPADGLEMLNFINNAARDSGAPKAAKAKRFHIRRRSGKVFGPFDEGVVVKMMEDGQLLGNEDVSTDGDSWSPMATVASFGQAIQKLMEGPGAPAAAPGAAEASGEGAKATQGAQNMDRLRQLYEGRMAGITVVNRRDASEKLRKRLPLLIGAGVAALLLITGGSFAFTSYGAFGVKKFFPAKLSTSSPQYADLQAARRGILTDTFKSYREARDLTAKILAIKEYPEVRAVWCQAVFYLQRRYAAMTAGERNQADVAIPEIKLLGVGNVETAKALAGAKLSVKQPGEAVPILLDAKSRSENDQDVELDMLLAEAYAAKGDAKSSLDVLEKVLAREKGSAKALHALGNLHQAANRAGEAVQAYEAALAATCSTRCRRWSWRRWRSWSARTSTAGTRRWRARRRTTSRC